MFGLIKWIRQRLRERRARRQRLLFEYFDGTRYRRIDPHIAWRSFEDDPEFNMATMIDATLADEEPEYSYFLNAVCRAFDVKRYDDSTGEGLSEMELFGLFGHLHTYLENVKKKFATGPTLSQLTAGESSTATVAPNSTTSSPLDSGCLTIGPETALADPCIAPLSSPLLHLPETTALESSGL